MAAKTAIELFNEMAKGAGFTDEQVKLALARPEYKELENGFVRHDEYSSALDKAKNLEGKAKEAQDWKDWYSREKPKIDALNERNQILARYEERFGALDGTQQVQQAAVATGVSQADIVKMLDERDKRYASVIKDVGNLASRHASMFGEGLDFEAVEKIAVETGLPVTKAYEQYIAPRVLERQQKQTAEEIDRQVKEKVADELSRRQMGPASTSHAIPASFIQPPTGADAPKPLGDQELSSMWSDAGKTAAA